MWIKVHVVSFSKEQLVEDEFFLGKHPLTSLEGAGCMQQVLRKQFHCLLQTVAKKMPLVSEQYYFSLSLTHLLRELI